MTRQGYHRAMLLGTTSRMAIHTATGLSAALWRPAVRLNLTRHPGEGRDPDPADKGGQHAE